MEMPYGNAGLVAMLTTMLEQAQKGELTSFAGVTFRKNGGGADHSAWISRSEDAARVVGELKALAQEEEEMIAG